MDETGQAPYRAGERRSRARPRLTHPRYANIRRFRAALESVIRSDSIPAGDLVVDFGCAERPYERLLSEKFGRYLGVDLPGNRRADRTVGSDGRVPLEDGVADCVISTQVLEHVADPVHYLAEAYRLLRADGRLLLSTHGFWIHHPDPVDYWRWTLEGLRLQLVRSGFEVLRCEKVLGLAATAAQLWQEATMGAVPRIVRPLYVAILQVAILVLDRARSRSHPEDAVAFLVVARRPA